MALATLALAGCHPVGPNYATPPAAGLAPEFKEPGPTTFKETDGWKAAQPSDATLRGKWWELFSDPQLNALEEQIDPANQTLKAADANFRAARAAIGLYRANLAPTLSVGPEIGALRDSANQPYAGTSIVNGGQGVGNFLLPLDLNYEVDLWGRIRRSVTAARETAQASDADLETARLSLHAELALDYFGLRADDAQKKLLDDTVATYRRALQLTQDRYNGGASPLSDVTQARTQLQTALVQDSDVTIERAQYEHAIAVLTGQAPAAAHSRRRPRQRQPARHPRHSRRAALAAAGAPPRHRRRRAPHGRRQRADRHRAGRLLPHALALRRRRPQRHLAAQPLHRAQPLLRRRPACSTQTLYDHGRRRAGSDIALAQYDSTVANYRQTTLTAFQQVEDNLAALRVLETEASQQRDATDAAQQSLDLFNTRYEGGVDTYLQVVTAQTTALANQRNDIEIERRRLEASVLLIKALGGGWTTTQLPKL